MSATLGKPKTLTELRELVQRQLRRQGKRFRRADDDWPPMLMYVQTPDRGVEVAQIPGHLLELGRQKRVVMDTLRHAMRIYRGGVIRFALVVNVHGATFGDAGSARERELTARVNLEEIRVEDLPEAREYLWLVVGDAETEEHWQCQIQRDERRPPTLSAWINLDELDDDVKLSGRFIGLNEALRS